MEEPEAPQELALRLRGMTCDSCSVHVESAPRSVPGLQQASLTCPWRWWSLFSRFTDRVMSVAQPHIAATGLGAPGGSEIQDPSPKLANWRTMVRIAAKSSIAKRRRESPRRLYAKEQSMTTIPLA